MFNDSKLDQSWLLFKIEQLMQTPLNTRCELGYPIKVNSVSAPLGHHI
jgi:hypothetical protein